MSNDHEEISKRLSRMLTRIGFYEGKTKEQVLIELIETRFNEVDFILTALEESMKENEVQS